MGGGMIVPGATDATGAALCGDASEFAVGGALCGTGDAGIDTVEAIDTCAGGVAVAVVVTTGGAPGGDGGATPGWGGTANAGAGATGAALIG